MWETSVEGFTEVQVGNSHSRSLVHQAGHLVTEGGQDSRIGPALHEHVLTGLEMLFTV